MDFQLQTRINQRFQYHLKRNSIYRIGRVNKLSYWYSNLLQKTCENQNLGRVLQSDLIIVQKIHAIKTIIIPSLKFILENCQMKLAHLNKLDQFISSQINIIIGANIPRAVKHASWKDVGLSIPSLREKANVGRVIALIRMITNRDLNIRILINSAIDNERIKRNILVASNDEKNSFFNWSSSHTTTESEAVNQY